MTRTDLLNFGDDEILAHCKQDFFKASGPGGQKKNKTSSAVRLILNNSSIQASASEDRQQSVNKKRALRRLRFEIALNMRQSFEVWQGDWNINDKNPRFPLLAACLIDGLEGCNYQISDLSKQLGKSTSFIVKVLQKSQVLWRHVNDQRRKRDLKTLK